MCSETEALATYLSAQAETLRCIAGHPSLDAAPAEVRDASKEVARALDAANRAVLAIHGEEGRRREPWLLSLGKIFAELGAAWQEYLAAIARWQAQVTHETLRAVR